MSNFRDTAGRGLSPRIRGNPHRKVQLAQLAGSIPAHTGKPPRDAVRRRSVGVYPRAYGETQDEPDHPADRAGLSPRIRGNLREAVDLWTRPGSIPAHTGKPPGRCSRRWRARVYPRAYGETARYKTELERDWGLSPRIRGNRQLDEAHGVVPGSIPAHTGKPWIAARDARAERVYPRAYGETQIWVRPDPDDTGLSPRIRGNPRWRRGPGRGRGSIPAHTGKPTSEQTGACEVRVYPRAYGETRFGTAIRISRSGLSPRIRGNRLRSTRGSGR